VIASLIPAQHPRGGFGGGFGQLPHLATTYAAVLALASVGGNALDIINRRKMHVLPSALALLTLEGGGGLAA
jgi:protein farnesyltransferase subunit beta